MVRSVVVDPVEESRREEIDRSLSISPVSLKREWAIPGEQLIQRGAWIAERAVVGSAIASIAKSIQTHPDWLLIFAATAALLIGGVHAKSYKTHRLWFSLSLILIVAVGLGAYLREPLTLGLKHQPTSATAGKALPHSLGQGLKPGAQR